VVTKGAGGGEESEDCPGGKVVGDGGGLW